MIEHANGGIEGDVDVCPRCGSKSVITIDTDDSFNYGPEESTVELHATVPVNECSACGFTYLDQRAEAIRHAAVCQHLGLLTPKEVKQIRQSRGFARGRFSQLSGIGEASLARWERGASFQSKSNDRLLRLLRFDDNIRRLKEVAGIRKDRNIVALTPERRFRFLVPTSAILKEQEAFSLRAKAK